ncbi:NUDIX hydrolase domain-like protein [Sordaria brevicollis]|uniref:NUDIX hydrolase domain-like protein n=1 Tax=Sordaria brevicollis TaxID=83679 RepID=A0AAE0PLT5_SORBR|nr:NUDIX hydrolase domain-like protein [Sordaria brevicollis]
MPPQYTNSVTIFSAAHSWPDVSTALHQLRVSLETDFLLNRIKGVIVSAVVMHQECILLVQRAATDGFPNKWETPGGGMDAEKEEFSGALARELQEETGLVLKDVLALLDRTEFEGASGEGRYRKYTFLVSVEDKQEESEGHPKVILNPEEHQDYAWASLKDLRVERCGEREINWAYPGQRETLYSAFRTVEKMAAEMDKGGHKAAAA